MKKSLLIIDGQLDKFWILSHEMEIKIIAVAFSMLFCCSLCTNLYSQTRITGNTKRDYQSLIKSVILKISEDKDVSDIELQKIIPRTEAEFIEYISYGYTDSLKAFGEAFYKIDLAIAQKARNNLDNFFILFLEIAPFADGMYAEIYFDKVEMAIDKNRILFCKIFNSLNEESKNRLEEFNKQFCH
jgi:hypothetical protein